MKRNKSGFTLLEIIIVIIIVGVLASLALPRFFRTIEFSRSTEALSAFTAVRQSVERCYLSNNQSYADCTLGNLDVEDPADSPGNHFTYTVVIDTTNTYHIIANRNTDDGGTAGNMIVLTQGTDSVTRYGTGAFDGIR